MSYRGPVVTPWDALAQHLHVGTPVAADTVTSKFARLRISLANSLEGALAQAGWYTGTAPRYPAPTTGFDAPPPPQVTRPIVSTVRRLWLATYNPGTPGWYDLATGVSGSDVGDDTLFPWQHPEHAAAHGNFWLDTTSTPANRRAIDAISVGDLVIVQRSDPGPLAPKLRQPGGDVLLGVAIAISADCWDDETTGQRERRVSLMPAGRFTWPVPRSSARRWRRLAGTSFRLRPQLPHGPAGGRGFTLSAIRGDDIIDLLAVCGIHPDALAEPDIAILAARLRATAHGNEELWRYRYDHVLRQQIRASHEQAAITACRAAATDNQWLFFESVERIPNAGYDLRFNDADGSEVQVEVKGYSTRNLARVHLQPSQATRARTAAQGQPPAWYLFALLGVDSDSPERWWCSAEQVTELLTSGGIQVNR